MRVSTICSRRATRVSIVPDPVMLLLPAPSVPGAPGLVDPSPLAGVVDEDDEGDGLKPGCPALEELLMPLCPDTLVEVPIAEL
jgi:hypothetical protein